MAKTNKSTGKANITSIATAVSVHPGEISKAQMRDYEIVKRNMREVGGKRFALVPTELIFADPRFQRLTSKGSEKIKKLAAAWNPAKMDALRLSPHDEEFRFSLIDGYHRLMAARINGIDLIECEIIITLPADPHERLKAEAHLFVTQNNNVDLLRPMQKHNAGVLLGIPEYVALDTLLEKYGIYLRTKGSSGRAKIGELSGYSGALKIAKKYGRDRLEDVFKIILESRWNLSVDGFADIPLNAINTVLLLHEDKREEVIEACIKYMKQITPNLFISQGNANYPTRARYQRAILTLEDRVCDIIGADRLYLADSNIVRVFGEINTPAITPLTVVPAATESEAVSAS